MLHSVNALLWDGVGRLYAGGRFTIARTNISVYAAQANIRTVISKVFRNTNDNFTLKILSTPKTTTRVLVATNLVSLIVWESIYTNTAPTNGAWQFIDTNAHFFPSRFYRSSTP